MIIKRLHGIADGDVRKSIDQAEIAPAQVMKAWSKVSCSGIFPFQGEHPSCSSSSCGPRSGRRRLTQARQHAMPRDFLHFRGGINTSTRTWTILRQGNLASTKVQLPTCFRRCTCMYTQPYSTTCSCTVQQRICYEIRKYLQLIYPEVHVALP